MASSVRREEFADSVSNSRICAIAADFRQQGPAINLKLTQACGWGN
jgi:hypothetical protein